MEKVSYAIINVADPGEEGKTIEFELELTEKIVKDFIGSSSKDYGPFESHDLDEWADLLEKESDFVSYVEEVFETEIDEKSYHRHHISEFDT